MKQTAVEWLQEALSLTFEQQMQFEGLFQQAKEMEKEQQGYSDEHLECAWNSSNQNMRFQFSSSAYKAITFKQWLEVFKQ